MEQNGNTNTAQAPRPCPKDCRQCSWMQHVFCTAQMSFSVHGTLNAMHESMARMEQRLARMEQATSPTDYTMPMSENPQPSPQPQPQSETSQQPQANGIINDF